jgi:methyl coenzyme M reductase subunit D
LLLTHSIGIEEISHLYVKDSNVLKVCNGRVISMMLVDHNDEMEMKVYDARLLIRIDDDANMLANSRDIAAEVVPVPHSLSFYTMFYKMTIEDRDEERRVEEKEGEKKPRCICSVV